MPTQKNIELDFNRFSEVIPSDDTNYLIQSWCRNGMFIEAFVPGEEDKDTIYKLEVPTRLREVPLAAIYFLADSLDDAFKEYGKIGEMKTMEIDRYIEDKLNNTPIIQMPGLDVPRRSSVF